MKKLVFVDTAAWIALINKSDALHEKARKVRDRLIKEQILFLVTDYVVVEVGNSLSRSQFRKGCVQLIDSILKSPNIQFVRIDDELFQEAWELYSSRPDKEWSLTDCSSFVVMKKNGVTEAFTSDHHFEQAGFTFLL